MSGFIAATTAAATDGAEATGTLFRAISQSIRAGGHGIEMVEIRMATSLAKQKLDVVAEVDFHATELKLKSALNLMNLQKEVRAQAHATPQDKVDFDAAYAHVCSLYTA